MKQNKLALFSLPYVVWMALFTVAPILLILGYAFTSSAGGFTLDNFQRMGEFWIVFLRSFQLAIVATAACLLIGYPIACFLAREGPRFQRIAMALIMLPMWMNFLLRTYAWMSILENTGLLNRLFSFLHVFDLVNAVNGLLNSALGLQLATDITYFKLIGTSGAVVLGMVYNYLPFMILPIYSVIVKLDHSLLEAAHDLGADSVTTFRRVIFPLSLPGILSGVTMVCVPSVSTFAISRLLGGNNLMLLGNLIELQFTGTAYDPYLGSAIALVMMVIVVACMYVMNRFGEGEEQAVML